MYMEETGGNANEWLSDMDVHIVTAEGADRPNFLKLGPAILKLLQWNYYYSQKKLLQLQRSTLQTWGKGGCIIEMVGGDKSVKMRATDGPRQM